MIQDFLLPFIFFLVGMALAVLGVGILARRAPQRLNRLVPSPTYDTHKMLREFSIGISDIHETGMLATVSIGLISEAVEISRGYLFEVEYEANPAPGVYRLLNAGGMGQLPGGDPEFLLSGGSPIAQSMHKKRQPVLTREIASGAEFAAASAEERAWFANLEMALLAPVHTKEDWIGLLALGPKANGVAFTEDDIMLVGTLADQLSLALQNSRLIASLMRVNNDFRRAYSAMEQSNRQLQAAINQLEKMDRTKSDFISVASHELRTPLTVMRGYTEMLVDDPAFKANPMHQKMLGGIHSSILRLHEIVESMLDVASIDAKTLSLHKQPLSMHYLINTTYLGLKNAADERKITITLEGLRDLPAVEADSEMLSKVFYQLLLNAIKYTPDGSSIAISGVTVSPGQLGMEDGGVEIIIADQGIGIEPGNLDLIFRKFYQTGKLSLHSTGKTKFKGSGPGLGLAIAKGIVDAHNGKIWAESTGYSEQTFPGSQFHVALPVK